VAAAVLVALGVKESAGLGVSLSVVVGVGVAALVTVVVGLIMVIFTPLLCGKVTAGGAAVGVGVAPKPERFAWKLRRRRRNCHG
jgi:hypothetical protein